MKMNMVIYEYGIKKKQTRFNCSPGFRRVVLQIGFYTKAEVTVKYAACQHESALFPLK